MQDWKSISSLVGMADGLCGFSALRSNTDRIGSQFPTADGRGGHPLLIGYPHGKGSQFPPWSVWPTGGVVFPLFARTHTGREVNSLRPTGGVVIHFFTGYPHRKGSQFPPGPVGPMGGVVNPVGIVALFFLNGYAGLYFLRFFKFPFGVGVVVGRRRFCFGLHTFSGTSPAAEAE